METIKIICDVIDAIFKVIVALDTLIKLINRYKKKLIACKTAIRVLETI